MTTPQASAKARQRTQLAHAWLSRQRLTQAQSFYLEALALDPMLVEARLGLTQAYLAQQRYADARETLRILGEQNPADRPLLQSVAAYEEWASVVDESFCQTEAAESALPAGPCDILLYTDSAGQGSGVAHVNRSIVAGLHAAGVRVVCAQPAGHPTLHSDVPHVALPNLNVYDPKRMRETIQAVERPAALMAALQPRLVLFSDGAPMSNLAAKAVAHEANIPFVCIVHCINMAWATHFKPLLPAIELAYNRAATVISVSPTTKRQLENAFGAPSARSRVIHNGLPEEFFAPRDETTRQRLRAELDVSPGTLLCLTVGRLDAIKGQRYLIDAIDRLQPFLAEHPVRFAWVGIGTEAIALRIALEQRNLTQHVRFLGRRRDIPDLLDAADLVILPSRFEGMPIAVLEAMAKGVPVMATSVSGTPDALGDCGVLLPDPAVDEAVTVEALAHHAARLCLAPTERHRLSAAGAVRARDLFRQERMVEEYRELLLPLLGREMINA